METKELQEINIDLMDLLANSNPEETTSILVYYPTILLDPQQDNSSVIDYLIGVIPDGYDLCINGSYSYTKSAAQGLTNIIYDKVNKGSDPVVVDLCRDIPLTVSDNGEKWVCDVDIATIIADADYRGLDIVVNGVRYIPSYSVSKNIGFHLSLLRVPSVRDRIWDRAVNPAEASIVHGVLTAFKYSGMTTPNPTWDQLYIHEYLNSPHNNMTHNDNGMGFKLGDDYTNYITTYADSRNELRDMFISGDVLPFQSRLLVYCTIVTCVTGLNAGMTHDEVYTDLKTYLNI